jgi:hypothetical protein
MALFYRSEMQVSTLPNSFGLPEGWQMCQHDHHYWFWHQDTETVSFQWPLAPKPAWLAADDHEDAIESFLQLALMSRVTFDSHVPFERVTWDFSLVFHQRCTAPLSGLINLCRNMLEQRELDEAFIVYFTEGHKEIKDISNKALVQVRTGGKKDLGNWLYTVLYDMLFELAKGSTHRNLHLFEQAATCWPSLALDAIPSETSLERKGDIVEIAIVLSKRAIARDRPTLMYYLMGEFHGNMLSIIEFISKANFDPCMRRNPQPLLFSRLLIHTYYLEHCAEPTDRRRCVRKACQAARELARPR